MSNTITLAIDPGKHHAGWAIFVDRHCVRAGVDRVKVPKDRHGPHYRQGKIREPQSSSALILAETISAHVEIARRIVGPCMIEIVSEIPHVYLDEDRKMKSKCDPLDLLFLALTCGTIAGEIRRPKRARHVEPGAWKGQRGDETTWKWIRSIASPAEIEALITCGVYDDRSGSGFHHGLEAFGIGAWSLFRL